MADAIERVRATADQQGIEIVLHEPSPPVAVMGDRRQLVSAMHALLENAITYSYDNSKVVVSGTVQRATPTPTHPAVATAALVEDAVTGPDPVTRPEPVTGPPTGEVPTGEVPAGPPTGEVPAGPPTGEVPTGEVPIVAHDEAVTGEVPVVRSTPEAAAAGDEGEKGNDPDPNDRPGAPTFTPEILDQYSPASGAVTASPATGTTAPVASAEGDVAAGGAADALAGPNWRVEDRDTVRLSVQDHGIGIPARDLDRIFERFYRVDHGRSRDTGGTGLGLSIVRHVANNHQGWVDVESREGEGSTFTLVLPIQTERVA